ncbi:hypothetical protein AOQ84DRAFT_435739 [Glonium stellatum]|uniref:Azaphilone pigments biosynthesis cluster protein L N-terminal domain-containing protein n=1 Tax=Glonium stellatum TaxID=574774 RepID=A0A8E2JYP3_9PEZI|nr:hypothetical protein AOQ84DRAFT_435739 [Glonium stellatum]
MDPLSIASSAAGIAGLCIRVYGILYTFVDDARSIDDSISGLCEEILGLSRVLKALSQAWNQNPLLVAAQANTDGGSLWTSVQASLDDCENTLGKLEKKLDEVQKSSFLGRGFLRKPTMSIKLNVRMRDISAFKQQMHSYSTAMQSALQMINVNTSQESIAQVLTGLKSQIGRVESALQARNDTEPSSSDMGEDSERISRNLRLLVRAAESFHSSASTIVSDGARSTVWAGSVMGDPLSDERHQSIKDWIPPPSVEEENRTQNQVAKSNVLSSGGTEEDSGQDSETDSDMEKDMLKKFQDLAIASFSQGDYPKAEQFLVKFMDRSTRNNSPENMVTMKLMQAYAYGYQGNWDGSERVLLSLATLKGTADSMVFYGLHALALRKLDMGAYDSAIRHCRRALMGWRRTEGKESAQFYESMALLAHIYEAEGDSAEAEGCRSFLPAGYSAAVQFQPLEYLIRPLTQYFPHHSASHLNFFNESPGQMAPEKTEVVNTRSQDVSNSFQGFTPVPAPPPELQSLPARGTSPSPSPIIHGSPQSSEWSDSPPQYSERSDTPSQSSERSNTPPQSSSTPERRHSPKINHKPKRKKSLLNSLLTGLLQFNQNSAQAPQHSADQAFAQPDNSTIAPVLPLAPQTQPKPPSEVRIIVAIDFGTLESSVAFAFSVDMETKEEVINAWPNGSRGTKQSTKVPTALYYNSVGEVAGWGHDIIDAHTPAGCLKPGYQKLEWFKLQLIPKRNCKIDLSHLPPLLSGMSAVDVAADYLSKLRQATHDHLKMCLGDVFRREEQKIHYYFSVPAIWNDSGNANLCQAIVKAGFVPSGDNHRLTLIAEPKEIATHYNTTGVLNLSLNDAILIIDCGTETVHLIAYSVAKESPLKLRGFTVGSIDCCGSTVLDQNFENLLRAKIGRTDLPSGSFTAERIYFKAITDFGNRIKNDFRNSGHKWAIDLVSNRNGLRLVLRKGIWCGLTKKFCDVSNRWLIESWS